MRKLSRYLFILFGMVMLLVPYNVNAASATHDNINKMMDSLFIIEGASGILVYSDGDIGYILTAFHVVSDFYTFNVRTRKNEFIKNKRFIVTVKINPHQYKDSEYYTADMLFGMGLDVDLLNDLALIKVKFGTRKHQPVRIAVDDPELGDDIYIVANPHSNYNSITKGILSSKARELSGANVWQISGGVVPGSSGGGAFNVNGELVGIAGLVQYYKAKTNNKDFTCDVYMPFLGFFTPLPYIRTFLLNSSIAKSFDYLK